MSAVRVQRRPGPLYRLGFGGESEAKLGAQVGSAFAPRASLIQNVAIGCDRLDSGEIL